ncbi:MAG: hypothetical protein KGZ25_12895 [Planctomycetes bacterium]|nr:hypothetical protein [Planctomycetota bacterium]
MTPDEIGYEREYPKVSDSFAGEKRLPATLHFRPYHRVYPGGGIPLHYITS